MKNILKRFLTAVVVLIFACQAAFLSSCSLEKSEAADPLKSEETGMDEVALDDAFPMEYVNAYGISVTIEQRPETIVSVSPAMTEIVFALGQEDRLIGRSDFDDYPPEALEIPSVGAIDMPNVETIVALEPDMVLASSIFSEEAFNTLTELGITVVIVRDETSVEGMFDVISEVGQVIGSVSEADSLVSELEAELIAIQEETSLLFDGVEDDEKPTVYYCMGFGDYGEYTAGGDTFINDIIEMAGLKNAAGDITGWAYSLEALIEADPDYILVPEWGYDSFISTAPYSELTACVEGNVLMVDYNEFERQGPRNVDAIRAIFEFVSEDF